MKKVPLNKDVILGRLSEIKRDLERLIRFQKISLPEFKTGENFAIAEHYLRRCLEAIFELTNHILSRFSYTPQERPSTYKSLAVALGEKGIVPEDFANVSLLKMAGYRTRLVHFYSEISQEELYQIIKDNLSDIEKFTSFIIKLLDNPQKFGLTII